MVRERHAPIRPAPSDAHHCHRSLSPEPVRLASLEPPPSCSPESPEPHPPPGLMAAVGPLSSPLRLPPALPETPLVGSDRPRIMKTKLFEITPPPVRRILFANHLHGCPYSDAHILGMAKDHPTPPARKRRSRLECNCAKLLEEGYDKMEEDEVEGHVARSREVDTTPVSMEKEKGLVLAGRVCATLSWSSPATSPSDDVSIFWNDGREDDQQSLQLPSRTRSGAPSPYTTIEGRPENLYDPNYEDDEINDADVESNLDFDGHNMGRLTLCTASFPPSYNLKKGDTTDEDSDAQTEQDPDVDSDTEMESEANVDHNSHLYYTQGGFEHEADDDEDGVFPAEKSQQSVFDHRAALTAMAGGPKKALWFPVAVDQ